MSTILGSLVTSLVIPFVSTSLVSEVKKRALVNEANVFIDLLEERVLSYALALRPKVKNVTIYCGETEEDVLAQITADEADPGKNPEKLGALATKIAVAITQFSVRYPDAEAGKITHKEIVCDLFSVLSDVSPVLRALGLNEDYIEILDMGISQVSNLILENKEKEAADMVFLGLKELCSNTDILEVLGA